MKDKVTRLKELLMESGRLSQVTITTTSSTYGKVVVLGLNIVKDKTYVDILDEASDQSFRLPFDDIKSIY
jgi:hypothetical protein